MSRNKRQEYWELYGGRGEAPPPERVHVGLTATRIGLRPAQLRALGSELAWRLAEADRHAALHLGDCVGGDVQAWAVGLALGYRVIGHPPDAGALRAGVWYHEQRPPHPPLTRNRLLVAECRVLLALPRLTHEEQRSGTWATVRHARKLGREIALLWPDGHVTRENVP